MRLDWYEARVVIRNAERPLWKELAKIGAMKATMKRLSILSILLVATAAAFAEPSDSPTTSATSATTPPPTASELHAAQCVAALEVSTEGLAARVKAGQDDARGPLQTRLEAGTAFVGDAYLKGTRDQGRAKGLANKALEDQKSLSATELAARQDACADEGQKLMAASNGFERAIVRQMAKKRMAKLLAG
jgi:hypothetical protein